MIIDYRIPTYISQGGLMVYTDRYTDRRSVCSNDISSSRDVRAWYGFLGLGGSVFQWHPDQVISFAYIPSFLDWTDFTMAKGVKLRDTVFECAMNLKKKE